MNMTTEAKTKTEKPAKKAGAKKTEKKAVAAKEPRESIRSRIFALFQKKGIDNVTFEEAEAAAQKVKPDTAFAASHLAWYRTKYKELQKA